MSDPSPGRARGRRAPKPPPERLLLRLDEAVTISGQGKTTIRKLISMGVLRAIKPTGTRTCPVHVLRSELVAWIEAGCPLDGSDRKGGRRR